LPLAIIVCAETTEVRLLRPVGIVPAVAANVLILFGLWQMGSFQKQERPWRHALDRAKLLAVINLGLCPFLFWFNRMPEQLFFRAGIFIFVLSALLFLFNLNVALKQLSAMLPDETLRQETRQFTALNRWLLVIWITVVAISVLALQLLDLPALFGSTRWQLAQSAELALLLFLGLTPLAVTMALIWKTKQVILDSVFGMRS